MTKYINDYFKRLVSFGWKITQIYKGDYIPTYEFERFVVNMDRTILDHKNIEITLYTKAIKKGHIFILNGEIYPNEDEVILELNRLGIK